MFNHLNYSIFFLVSVCLCVTFSKNVDNFRIKRTIQNTENNCENVRPFFEMRNISVQPFDRPKGPICGGQCCSGEIETTLRVQGQKDFASLLRHNSRSVQGLLNSTATLLQNHIMELTSQSENKTLLVLSQVYGRMSTLSREPIRTLYGDIRRYIHINTSRDAFSTTDVDIKASVLSFFTDLFPLAYHQIAKTFVKDFSYEYKSCLKKTINEISPFGDIPRQLSQSLLKSLEATRLLLQAFSIGVEVLNSTDTLFAEEGGKGNVECHHALMKMTYCPKCLGLSGNTKPCSGYCLNVLSGCLTKYVAELDAPWNSYVEAVEKLVMGIKQHNNEVGVNVDLVIRALDSRISEAIMHAMEKEHEIDVRVKRTCGAAKLLVADDPSLMDTTTAASVPGNGKQRFGSNMRVSAPSLTTPLQEFLISIAKSKSFYGNLADSLCRDDSFAEPKDQHCWNGEKIGEYTKTIVLSGLDMHKYNPEVKVNINLQTLNPQIANLADKLRHVYQMVISSLGATPGFPESDNYMQSDSADGSGSGGGSDFSDDSDDIDSRSGSGSGNGPDIDRGHNRGNTYGGNNNGDSSTKTHATETHTTKHGIQKQKEATPSDTTEGTSSSDKLKNSLLFTFVILITTLVCTY